MNTPQPFRAVQPAQPPKINDRNLAHLRRIAHDAPNDVASGSEVEWLLTCSGPLLDELAALRAFVAGLNQPVDLSNIIVLPAVRA